MSKENKKYTVTIHSSLQQSAEEEAKYIVNQSPVNRIRETVQLILRVYPSTTKKQNTNLIYFDKE